MHSPEKSQMSRFHLKPNWSCSDFLFFFFTRLKKNSRADFSECSTSALHFHKTKTNTNKQTNNCAVTKLHVTSLFLSLCHLSWCSGLAFLVCTSVGFQVFHSGSHRLIFINSSVMQYLQTSSSLDTRHERYFFSGGNQAL